jgi:hypothetical protein
MDALQDAIQAQPRSKEITPPPPPPKSPYRNKLHQMSKADAQLPATAGAGLLKQSQDLHTVTSRNVKPSPQRVKEVRTSSVNIIIPPEAKQPPEIPLLMEDPNVVGAVAKLTAPREPGETSQVYEQRRAAAERWRGTPTPAFIGQAGERSKQWMEHSAPPKLQLEVKPEEVTTSGTAPTKKPKKVPMAEKLEDRVAYQHMRNEDLSTKGRSLYENQGIAFSVDGKVIDEMKRLYQSSLKAAAAPGGDPGDDGDDESDDPPDPDPR